MNLDVLAVGAHPDDADLGVGGTLAKLSAAGYRVGILDLSRGELSSRGTPEERADEAQRAAGILGIAERSCLNLPDGQIENRPDYREKLIAQICENTPGILIAHAEVDRHPDHRAAHALTRDANFFAGVGKAAAPAEPHRARHVYYFRPYFEDAAEPLFVVDITEHFETKLSALHEYKSQLHNPAYTGRETYVSSESFWNQIRIRAEYWGARIGVGYGEPFFGAGPLSADLLPGLGVRT